MAVKVLIIGWCCACVFGAVALAMSLAGNEPLCIASSFASGAFSLLTPLFAMGR